MGKNSRKLAVEEFDWKKIAEKYLEVYEEKKSKTFLKATQIRIMGVIL